MKILDLKIKEVNNYGSDEKLGNLLGIEPYVLAEDYSSVSNLRKKLEGYLLAASEMGWINEKTIVLWPEYIGTWLVVSEEAPAYTLQGVVKNIIKAHPKEFNAFLATATEQDKPYAAVLRTKATAMAEAYQTVFSGLSKKYGVTTVAGSIALPAPQILNGELVPDVKGPIYNVSVVFGADGRLDPQLVCKAYPTSGELPYTKAAPVGGLPAFDTPAGRLGILICADSFYPQAYTRMKALKVEFLAVPSFGHGGLKAWKEIWKGYDGWPNPQDVDKVDINRITNSEAWLRYSLIGRIDESTATRGVNVFLHGNLWPDLDAGGGVAAVVNKGDVWNRENKTEYATLNNLWL